MLIGHAHELRGRARLRQACPHADVFIAALAVQGGNLGSATKRLLGLLGRFGAAFNAVSHRVGNLLPVPVRGSRVRCENTATERAR
jgi:hypothetical protein